MMKLKTKIFLWIDIGITIVQIAVLSYMIHTTIDLLSFGSMAVMFFVLLYGARWFGMVLTVIAIAMSMRYETKGWLAAASILQVLSSVPWIFFCIFLPALLSWVDIFAAATLLVAIAGFIIAGSKGWWDSRP